MKRKNTLKLLTILTLLISFACKDELDDCYETICTGPNNTNCREEPIADSGCFPPPDNGALNGVTLGFAIHAWGSLKTSGTTMTTLLYYFRHF